MTLVAIALPAAAQQPRPVFSVDISPVVAVGAGRAVTVTYEVRFHSATGDSLASFMVSSPVPVREVRAPAALAGDMLLGTREGEQSAAVWAWIDAMPRDGQGRSGLAYDAEGMPGIVRYRLERFVAPHEASPGEMDDDPKVVSLDAPDQDQLVGFTVGIVPPPAVTTDAALAARLRELLAQSCGSLGWVSPSGICNSLDVKLEHTAAAFAEGNRDAAARHLDSFLMELDAQRGKHVTDPAYALLRSNALLLRPGA